MADNRSIKQRSENMRRIRGKNTLPEIQVRRTLHRMGFRFRLHDNQLPGSPDIVLPKWKCAIFVHGCFWHGHNCKRGRGPKTNIKFWKDKIAKNKLRDKDVQTKLKKLNWRVLVVWQCRMAAIENLSRQIEMLNKH